MSADPTQIESFSATQLGRCAALDGVFGAFIADLGNLEGDFLPVFNVNGAERTLDVFFSGHGLKFIFLLEIDTRNSLLGRLIVVRTFPSLNQKQRVIDQLSFDHEGLVSGVYESRGSTVYLGANAKGLVWHFLYKSMKLPIET